MPEWNDIGRMYRRVATDPVSSSSCATLRAGHYAIRLGDIKARPRWELTRWELTLGTTRWELRPLGTTRWALNRLDGR